MNAGLAGCGDAVILQMGAERLGIFWQKRKGLIGDLGAERAEVAQQHVTRLQLGALIGTVLSPNVVVLWCVWICFDLLVLTQ